MTRKLVDEAMIGGVVSHPLRCKVLMILAHNESSPVEIGRQIGVDASHVAYHLRPLVKSGLIELTDLVPKRGAVEHRYVCVVDDAPVSEWCEKFTPAETSRRAFNILCVLLAEANCGLSAGSFEESHRLSRFPMELDEDGRGELRDLHECFCEALGRISEASADRLEAAGERGGPVTAFSGFFGSPQPTPTGN
jgi:DNA-binding transcriptional ArsR family regulator